VFTRSADVAAAHRLLPMWKTATTTSTPSAMRVSYSIVLFHCYPRVLELLGYFSVYQKCLPNILSNLMLGECGRHICIGKHAAIHRFVFEHKQ
jgi:hypothetical protein